MQLGAPESREQYVHRTGRTGRAGKSGQALLLLSDWEERSSLRMLDGLPLARVDAQAAAAGGSEPASVAAAVAQVDEVYRQKAYQAWLGYYKAKMKALRWDPPRLVATANSFAAGALGLDEVPTLQARVSE